MSDEEWRKANQKAWEEAKKTGVLKVPGVDVNVPPDVAAQRAREQNVKDKEAELQKLREQAAGEAEFARFVRESERLFRNLDVAQKKAQDAASSLPDQVKGAFSAPDWRQAFGIGDNIAKQALDANQATAKNTGDALEILKKAGPLILK
jgi:hypothetical protein